MKSKLFVELFLYYLGEKTIFLDLCDHLGVDTAIEVIKVFGGTTIKVPDTKVLKQCIRDVDIYYSIINNEADRSKMIPKLSEKYNLSHRHVEIIFGKIKALCTENKLDEYITTLKLDKELRTTYDIDNQTFLEFDGYKSLDKKERQEIMSLI